MYVTCENTPVKKLDIVRYMPRSMRSFFYNSDLTGMREIRLRQGKPVCIYLADGCYYISRSGELTRLPNLARKTSNVDIEEAVELATASSVYSVKEEMKNGYITLRGGHRAGITGEAVIKNDRVDFIKDISSVNYRVAHEIIGAADGVIGTITSEGIKNTLIISPPGAGKTTMLRDVARQLSYMGKRVSIVDERREIAALCEGVSPFDLGFNTDVLSGADKAEGMIMVIRAMAPEVIVTDEIGKAEDIEAIKKATASGASIITTMHGRDISMIKNREDLKDMLKFFDIVIILSDRQGAGTVEEIVRQW